MTLNLLYLVSTLISRLCLAQGPILQNLLQQLNSSGLYLHLTIKIKFSCIHLIMITNFIPTPSDYNGVAMLMDPHHIIESFDHNSKKLGQFIALNCSGVGSLPTIWP